MGILAWIVVGAIAGWLASMVVHSSLGLIGDIVVGIVGAFIGGFLFNLIGQGGVTGLNLYSIVVAFIGAVVLLVIIRVIRGEMRPRA